MRTEIRPEPDPSERTAILAALERAVRRRADDHPAYRSAWRRAGLVGDPYAVARPRRSRGATRA